MRTVLSTILMLLLISANAQNYEIEASTGTSFPYEDGTEGTEIISPAVNDVLSEWQTIPFSFNFYGNPVTGYFVSDNGYLTFDSEATESFPNNTAIPTTEGPNHAIYTFWDDLEVAFVGLADRVSNHTYGDAPHRVHVIQWAVTPVGTEFYFYVAIRLYEDGNFDVVYSRGNGTGFSATIGCENVDGTIGAQVAGSPNIDVSENSAWNANDVVYTFYWQGIQYDMALISFEPENGITLIPGEYPITGEIENRGAENIESFDLVYTVDGGDPQMATINASIPANGGTYNFTHDLPLNITTGGVTHEICVWAENLNGSFDDQNPGNDQLCHNIKTGTTSAPRTVLLEEFTGAWCGSCINGPVVMDEIHELYPDNVVMVSIHKSDAMEFNDGITSGFNTPYWPSGMIDRTLKPGDEWEFKLDWEWQDVVEEHFTRYTPAEVSMEHTYNPETRELTMTLTADYVDLASGDMRFITMVVEDSLVGEGEGWDQVNYYNEIPGHPYYGAGNPVIGFVHNHVLRAVPSGAFGNSGVIPAQVSVSDSYSETISYTLPDGFNESKISLIGFLAYYGDEIGSREVLNAVTLDLHEEGTVGLNDIKNIRNFTIFPNPSTGLVNIMFDLNADIDPEILISDAWGKQVAVINEKAILIEGRQQYSYDTSELESGLYFVSVMTEGIAYTKQLVIIK